MNTVKNSVQKTTENEQNITNLLESIILSVFYAKSDYSTMHALWKERAVAIATVIYDNVRSDVKLMQLSRVNKAGYTSASTPIGCQ